jgi:hypothetical protein
MKTPCNMSCLEKEFAKLLKDRRCHTMKKKTPPYCH